jgi:hypothetical protein
MTCEERGGDFLGRRRPPNSDSVNKWKASVFHGLPVPIERISRCALFLNSIAERAAASLRRSARDCWSLVSRSPHRPWRPAAEGVEAEVEVEAAVVEARLEAAAAPAAAPAGSQLTG